MLEELPSIRLYPPHVMFPRKAALKAFDEDRLDYRVIAVAEGMAVGEEGEDFEESVAAYR